VSGTRGGRPTAPAGLWDRPEMAAALAEHDMGTVVRIFRRWTGASQSDISVLVGLPQPHISELERGGRRITALALFERFADGLGIPRRLLGLADHPESTGSVERDEPVAASQREWLRVRRVLNANRVQLTHAVSRLYDPTIRLGETGSLMPENWRLPQPVDLAAVRLVWHEGAPAPKVNGQQGETRPVRPLASPGRAYPTYHRAMRDLDRPRLFENRLCFRLLDVEAAGGSAPDSLVVSLTSGNMCYFDMIDVGECLAHEAAKAALAPSDRVDGDRIGWQALPFRRLLTDPFDLASYPLMLSVSTLTVRQSRAGTTFLLLRRNPAKVAIGGGMLSVFPTGVFQPASVLPAPESPDFDLWRNVMREYSEEYLGNPEHDGDGPPIDYDNEEPFRSLDAARRGGKLRVYCLGVGIDALNYVGDVLTVAVFDADFFDRIFDGMVDQNDEGDVETEQFTFDDATVARLLAGQGLAPSGAACLQLAWQHRAAILV
jgi:transcriptional regulator with XRE-family HTH domain